MTFELGTFLIKPIVEELADGRFGIGERDQAVPDIARGGNIEVLADAAGAAAIVGDGHDRGDADIVRA